MCRQPKKGWELLLYMLLLSLNKLDEIVLSTLSHTLTHTHTNTHTRPHTTSNVTFHIVEAEKAVNSSSHAQLDSHGLATSINNTEKIKKNG